ncbi:MAG TPA: hypothetical protein VF512_02575 [Actinomycetota bacterium]
MTMLEDISPVPMVAPTGEGRLGATVAGDAAVADAVDEVLARGRSATTRPVTATPASRRASARTAATQRRLGATRRRVPAGATPP